MEYQYIIIGSGVAGATVAHNLLKHNKDTSILMVEAGPKVEMRKRRLWWDYVVSGERPYDFCEDLKISEGENVSSGDTSWIFKESRLMIYGGSTVHWGGWSLRFKPEDFELYSRTGRGADWPISYNELEPYYCHAEEYLSVGGDASDIYVPRSKPYPLEPFPYTNADGAMIESFKRLGISYAKMPIARFSHCMTTGTCKYCPLGARFSASYVLDELSKNDNYSNFTLVQEAAVSQLLMDSKDQVSGIKYFDRKIDKEVDVRGDQVIVCSGAYESPKLLLNSKNQYWANGIGNDNDLVGRFLISHPFLYARGKSINNPDKMQQEIDFPTLMSRHYDSPEEQEKGKLFMFKSRSRPRVKLANEMINGSSKRAIDEITTGSMEIELQGFMEEFSNFNNKVTVAQKKNRFGLPQTEVYFTRNADFEERAKQRLSLMKDVIEDMGLEFVKSGIRNQRGDHAASTCRMSKCPENGVVDSNLKVHGVNNLHICSNAVFPSGSAVNPTLTLTALSFRLAEHLININA